MENKDLKLTQEERVSFGRKALDNIAKEQLKINPNHHSASGIVDGKFAGVEGLNVNEDGNIVLTRQANSERHLTKNWKPSSAEDLLNTSLSQGGGGGLPTSGFKGWEKSFSTNASFTAQFVIPPNDLLEGIRNSKALIGNLGEGEIVLDPEWAKSYLSSVNEESIAVSKHGINYSKTNKSIEEGLPNSPKHLDSITIDLPIQKTFTDVPSEFDGKSSEWEPSFDALKRKYIDRLQPLSTSGVLQSEFDWDVAAEAFWNGRTDDEVSSILNKGRNVKKPSKKQEKPVEKVVVKPEEKPTRVPPQTVTPTQINQEVVQSVEAKPSVVNTPPKPLPKTTPPSGSKNPFKSFFENGDGALHSFDTETTGLDYKNKDLGKRARIWQVALATHGVEGSDIHVNPIYETLPDGSLKEVRNLNIPIISDILQKTSSFSKRAFNDGNFNNFLDDYASNTTSSLSESLSKTLGSVGTRDVVVLQNINFENNMLHSSVQQGIISNKELEESSKNFLTSSVDSRGNIVGLFQPPKEVQELTRRASFVYGTQFLKTGLKESWDAYLKDINKSFDKYKQIITDPNRKGAVTVELQDITRAFYANAAERGFIEKGTATLGLNIQFLTSTILDEPELHTAYSDAEQTNRLFLKITSMTEELRSGNSVSETTKQILSNIKTKQPAEVNLKFLSSIKSVISDFSLNKETNFSKTDSWYSPETLLKEKDATGLVEDKVLHQISTGKGRDKTKNITEALNRVLENYVHFENDLYGFNREKYVDNLLKDFRNTDYMGMLSKVSIDHDNYKPDFSVPLTSKNLVRDVEIPKQVVPLTTTLDTTRFLGKEVSAKTKKNILIGGAMALGAMALTTKPDPSPDNSGNVSENFYDEQYLGTAFVDFKERNKHYMM